MPQFTVYSKADWKIQGLLSLKDLFLLIPLKWSIDLFWSWDLWKKEVYLFLQGLLSLFPLHQNYFSDLKMNTWTSMWRTPQSNLAWSLSQSSQSNLPSIHEHPRRRLIVPPEALVWAAILSQMITFSSFSEMGPGFLLYYGNTCRHHR